jgi:hypothetical protein
VSWLPSKPEFKTSEEEANLEAREVNLFEEVMKKE